MRSTLTSKGQITIPRDVRQYFGLIKSRRKAVPADFDAAGLVVDAPSAKGWKPPVKLA